MTALDRVKREHLISDELLRRGIRGRRVSSNQKKYICPLPGHDDSDPSFTLYEDENRFHCFGCDRSGSVIDLIATLDNRDPKDVIRELTGGGEGVSTPRRNTATVQQSEERPSGCTLEQLAEKCGLPIDHLKACGVADMNYMSNPAVRIPYTGPDGQEAAVQYRVALHDGDGPSRFKWKRGTKPTLYGWPNVQAAKDAGYLVICEGASDVWTLRYHDFPVIGLPSATGWKEEYADALVDVDRIFVVVEPDAGGETVRETFKTSQLAAKVRLIYMQPEAKDPNDLHKSDPDGFKAAFNALLGEAVPVAAELRQEAAEGAQEAWSECASLAAETDILCHLARSLRSRGVAGEERLAKIVFLALVSRFFDRPVSVALKGPSSGGKSFVIERVLDYFPGDAYYTLSAMSERALAYMTEPLKHRYLVVYEAAGMEGEMATYLIRSLLSEGCIRYLTVEKTSDGLVERLIEREGPTGLLVTTTRASLHPENETRLLSLTVTDTPEQTRAVFLALADEDDSPGGDDLGPWLALQTWLRLAGVHRVTIPYAKTLAGLVPPVAVRLRRDFRTVLNLISAHALLHQANREIDARGRIIATTDDYAVIRDLVADLVAGEVGATVPETVKETVTAVREIYEETGDHPVANKIIAKRLGLDTSSTSRRLAVASRHGYVQNLQSKKGAAAQWVPADPLPDDQDLLPQPEVLQCCSVAVGDRTPPLPPQKESAA